MGSQGGLPVAKSGRLRRHRRRVNREHSTSHGRHGSALRWGVFSSRPARRFGSKNMPDPPSVHVPVLLDHVVHWLQPQPGAVLVDGTLGGGGHARAWPPRVGRDGLVIGIDRDPAAIETAVERLGGLPVKLVQANFCDLPEVLEQLEIEKVDGVLLDLGLSSDQLADRSRGFSFSSDGPLDLRFDPMSGEPARRLINRLSVEHLTQLISRYGEERYSPRIARAIVERRRRAADRDGRRIGRIGSRLRADPARRPPDRPGHADVSGPADRGERRIEVAGDCFAANPRLFAAGGTHGGDQFSLAGGSAGEGGFSDGRAAQGAHPPARLPRGGGSGRAIRGRTAPSCGSPSEWRE